MKFLFIGLGSIAKRHICNLRDICGSKNSITVLRSGHGNKIPQETEGLIDRVCLSENELESIYDVVFITNPTALHYETLSRYFRYSDAFFIEKPVFVTGEEDIGKYLGFKKKYYVAAPLRYSNVIQWLKAYMDFSTVHSIRVISSSYLPDWRPGADYRKIYSAHKDMGGGVSIDLIHEWDYLSYLIGFPKSVKSIISRKSNLEIDSDDIAVYIAEYEDKVAEVHLDYFGRKSIRKMELFSEDDTIVADLIGQRISWIRTGRELDLSEDRDSFQKKELQHFIDIVNGMEESDNNLEEACKVLRIARGVE